MQAQPIPKCIRVMFRVGFRSMQDRTEGTCTAQATITCVGRAFWGKVGTMIGQHQLKARGKKKEDAALLSDIALFEAFRNRVQEFLPAAQLVGRLSYLSTTTP
jgi:hypothetical protein